MAEFIATELVPLYKRIRIAAVVGNHGRTSRKPEFKSANKNWDWIAYKVMELRLAEFPQVSIQLPAGYEQVVEVCGKNILMFHGDGVPTNMPGVPWGGIQRRTKELSDTYAALGIRVDHFALGHYHEANVVGQKRILMNGSIKGPDEYSMKRYGGGRPACQLLHTFHPTRGLVGTDYLTLQ
jgi:predicted phosphodiesterase